MLLFFDPRHMLFLATDRITNLTSPHHSLPLPWLMRMLSCPLHRQARAQALRHHRREECSRTGRPRPLHACANPRQESEHHRRRERPGPSPATTPPSTDRCHPAFDRRWLGHPVRLSLRNRRRYLHRRHRLPLRWGDRSSPPDRPSQKSHWSLVVGYQSGPPTSLTHTCGPRRRR